MNYRKAMFSDIDDISWSMGTEFFDNIKNEMIDKFRQIF